MSPFVVRWIKLSLIALIGCSFLGLVIYALLNKDSIQSSQIEPPLISPPAEALKRRPDQPGGMDIPNRDKMVFDLLDGDKVPTALSATVEPSPAVAQPVTVQKLLAQVSSSVSPSAPVSGALVASTAAVAASLSDVQVPTPVTPDVLKPAEKVAEKAVAKPAEKPVAKVAEKPAAQPAKADAKLAAKGDWAVQVAAVGSKTDGDALVAKLKALPGLKPLTPRVAATPDGKRYRVQFVGLTNRDDAAALCGKLAGKTSCFPAQAK